MALKVPSYVGKRFGDFVCLKQLGSGSFGIVHVWKNQVTGERLALKKCRFGPEVLISEKHCEQWRQEVDIMLRIQHLNLVKCRKPPDDLLHLDANSALPLLCMEYCTGGDLRKFLNQGNNCAGLSEDEVKNAVTDIASALGFLHNRRIIHRDLKPENIVLDLSDDARIVFKLIDLGYAKELGQSSLALSFVGTLQYIAPELFLEMPYTKAVDYWSLGLITFEIITGVRPFLPNLSPGQWMQHVSKKSADDICIYQDHLNEEEIIATDKLFPENHLGKSLVSEFEVFLRSLLQWDPNKRGKDESSRLVLFDQLTELISKKRIKVVCMDRKYDKLDYVCSPGSNLQAFKTWLRSEIEITEDSVLLLSASGLEVDNINAEDIVYVYETFYRNTQEYLTEWNQHRKLDIPNLLQTCLKNPRQEIPHQQYKKACSHLYFFVRREHDQCLAMQKGLGILGKYLTHYVKEHNARKQHLFNSEEKCRLLYEFFIDGLGYDMDKYVQSQGKENYISSNQIFDSWVRGRKTMISNMEQIGVDMEIMSRNVAKANSVVKRTQTSLEERLAKPIEMTDLLSQCLQKVEKLKKIPVEGRNEKENAKDVALMAMNCLKLRDKFLSDHFQLISRDCYDILGQMRSLERLQNALQSNMDKFASEIARLQKRRQSDMWKLLNAALGSVSPQLPRGNYAASDSILEENDALSRQLQDLHVKLKQSHDL